MAAPSQWTFRFGVELEFLLGSRSKKHKSWTALAEELSTRLARHGVPNHVNAGGEKTAENYREWSIVREVTVPADVSKGFCKSIRSNHLCRELGDVQPFSLSSQSRIF